MKQLLLVLFCLATVRLAAQIDSADNRIDSFLLHQKGLIGKLARNLVANKPTAPSTPVRNDLFFERYRGKVIRNVTIRRLDFGTSLVDTSRTFKTMLTKLANDFHHKTTENVIRNNLFFRPGDTLTPFLFADNERHLRDLPFLQDARISVRRVGPDSVDVTVLTKDVLSLGGDFRMHNTTKVSLALSEDNLGGSGHEVLLRTFFDNKRNPKFAEGGEYTARNLGGSFIDWNAGYLTFNKNFTTGSQNEETVYSGFERPLVNPYMKFTYAANVAWHATHEVYASDTAYDFNTRYKYYNYDAWLGWNTGAFKLSNQANRDNRARTLLAIRYLQQRFSQVPLKYSGDYFYQYADIKALLGSLTIFRQDFYKTSYVYGFGLTEDIPEGADITFTGGLTNKSGLRRPYAGIDVQRYFFTERESYFHYTGKADAFFGHGRMEDVNLLFNLDYFSRLIHFGRKWQERTFVSVGAARQVNLLLNEPLILQSDFGVREWRADSLITGDSRVTLKVEAEFFTPLNIVNFRFAPFIFANLCRFNPLDRLFPYGDWYNSVGGGVRSRNESLIFQTIELRAFYYPKRNFRNERYRIEINSNIRFRFNRVFEKKPEFVSVNSM